MLNGIIFCLEFKVRKSKILEADIDQVLDYALDLKNFHKFSQDHIISPVLVATEYNSYSRIVQMSIYDDGVVNPLISGADGIYNVLSEVLRAFPNQLPIDPNWIISAYAPTPTIIEAAKTLYENHSVENITRHEADQVSTDRTIAFILEVIQESKREQKKSICFVTGVPGAGKTLVGLEVAIKQTYQGNSEPVKDEGAVYLSGNGPLVAVLTEALAQDNVKRCRERNEPKKLSDSRREVSKSIQMIHRYRDNMLAKIKNPVENGVLEIDPHKAVRMERAGWSIYISPKLTEPEYAEGKVNELLKDNKNVTYADSLHLAVSLRSFRAEKLSSFVHALLSFDDSAPALYDEIKDKYPIVLTRDIVKAKRWLHEKVRGTERTGVLITKESARYKPLGVHVLPSGDENAVHWFLEDKNDTRASNYLEDAATEIQVQGLELDYVCVLWDADMRYANGEWHYYRFNGKTQWVEQKGDTESKQELMKYMLNAYRVLLTRARMGMVICVPYGNANKTVSGYWEDSTRLPEYYDGTYEYLKSLGIAEL